MVPLAKFNGLAPAIVALVKIGRDAAELYQIVSLELLSESNRIKVIKRIYRLPQVLKVLLFYEDLVQSLVNSLVVILLDGAKVRFHKVHIVGPSEEGNSTSVIKAWGENYKEVVE